MRREFHVQADLHLTAFQALRALFRPHRVRITIALDLPPGTDVAPVQIPRNAVVHEAPTPFTQEEANELSARLKG